MTEPQWNPLDPNQASSLSDARRQLHHAVQFATALGISYLTHAADDSHTNLEWLREHRALASNAVNEARGAFRIAVRAHDLELLLIVDGSIHARYALRDLTITDAEAWLRTQLRDLGLDASRYTLARHYQIPEHPVGRGAPFSAEAGHLEQLARWLENADALLREVQRANSSDPVRCWPHHFDIATLIAVREGATVGVGLESGDAYYDEPYFYVNARPQPALSQLSESLEGGGSWHTTEWIGAVLSGSRLSMDADAQEHASRVFLSSAVRTCRSLLLSSGA